MRKKGLNKERRRFGNVMLVLSIFPIPQALVSSPTPHTQIKSNCGILVCPEWCLEKKEGGGRGTGGTKQGDTQGFHAGRNQTN